MADIKTPLCALQPTPAIPHTASRSGAGTRAGWRGGGGARARAGAGTERASRQPPAPAGRAGRAWLLEAPALRGPVGGRGGGGAWTPGADSPRLLLLTFSRSLSPSAVCWQAKVQGNYLHRTPAFRKAKAGELLGGAIAWDRRAPAPVTPARSRHEGQGRRRRPRPRAVGLGAALQGRCAPMAVCGWCIVIAAF